MNKHDQQQTWRAEIEELHAVFEAYFIGTIDSLDRVDAALAPDFTIVGPTGVENGRAATMQGLAAAHGSAMSLSITTTAHRMVLETDDMLIARYVETHSVADQATNRLSTVVFSRDVAAPNGLVWRSVHETWLPETS